MSPAVFTDTLGSSEHAGKIKAYPKSLKIKLSRKLFQHVCTTQKVILISMCNCLDVLWIW